MTLADQVAATAKSIVDTLVNTVYQHTDNIDPATRLYECDCNGFVAYVLSLAAPDCATLIPKEADLTRPLAHEYFDFFASLTPESTGGWCRVDLLTQAAPGDIMAWRFATIEPHQDTGHVVIVAEAATLDPSGAFYVLRVYDSAAEAHFDDTRAPAGQPAATGATGVGSGYINFKVDGAGRPIAYLFAPPATAQYAYRQVAIGRITDFSPS